MIPKLVLMCISAVLIGLWAVISWKGQGTWLFWMWTPETWQAVGPGLAGVALAYLAYLSWRIQSQQTDIQREQTNIQTQQKKILEEQNRILGRDYYIEFIALVIDPLLEGCASAQQFLESPNLWWVYDGNPHIISSESLDLFRCRERGQGFAYFHTYGNYTHAKPHSGLSEVGLRRMRKESIEANQRIESFNEKFKEFRESVISLSIAIGSELRRMWDELGIDAAQLSCESEDHSDLRPFVTYISFHSLIRPDQDYRELWKETPSAYRRTQGIKAGAAQFSKFQGQIGTELAKAEIQQGAELVKRTRLKLTQILNAIAADFEHQRDRYTKEYRVTEMDIKDAKDRNQRLENYE